MPPDSSLRRFVASRLTIPPATLFAGLAAAATPLSDPVDFFPAEDAVWPVARALIVSGVFVTIAVIAGLVAGALWTAFADDDRSDRRPRPARIDGYPRVVDGPVRSGGEWVRTVELSGGVRRVEMLTRDGWKALDGDAMRHLMALDTPAPSPRIPAGFPRPAPKS